jgi:hypothetical protein
VSSPATDGPATDAAGPVGRTVVGRWHRRGHPIVKYADGRWRWAATGRWLRLGSNPNDPPCARCGLAVSAEGADPCLGLIDGARSACCGHGVADGYITYTDGTRVVLPLPDTDVPPSP